MTEIFFGLLYHQVREDSFGKHKILASTPSGKAELSNKVPGLLPSHDALPYLLISPKIQRLLYFESWERCRQNRWRICFLISNINTTVLHLSFLWAVITEQLPTALRIDQNKKMNLFGSCSQFLRVWSNLVEDKIKQRLICRGGTVVARLANCTWKWLLPEHKSD